MANENALFDAGRVFVHCIRRGGIRIGSVHKRFSNSPAKERAPVAHTTQCRVSLTRAHLQHVEADLTHALRLVHAELEDRHVLTRAFVAQHAAAVPTVVLPHGERELGAALLAQIGLRPRRLRRQHVQQAMQ